MGLPSLSRLVGWRMNRRWRRGDRDGVERVAERYARRRPDDTLSWVLWGRSLIGSGKYEQAEAVLRSGLERHPNDPEIGWVFSGILVRRRQYEELEALLLAHAKANPDSRLPYLGLVRLAEAEGDIERAMACADQAERRTSPGDYGADYELALELSRHPATRGRALTLARMAADGMPHDAMSNALAGMLLELKGDPISEAYIQRARKKWESLRSIDSFLERARAGFHSPY
jgi:tetratricopeptide (TPR) repeat protein